MKKLLLTAALAVIGSMGANAAVVLAWDVAGSGSPIATTLAATTADANLDPGVVLSRNGITGSAAGNSFASTNWNITNTFDSTSKYISFSLSPGTGFTTTLTDVSFAINGSNTAPNTFEMGYSINGGAFVLAPTTTFTTTITSKAWDFTDFTVADTDTVEFRFWVYGTTSLNGGTSSSGGSARLGNLAALGNDLVLNGSVDAVPEPSTFALAGVALVTLWGLRRQRVKTAKA